MAFLQAVMIRGRVNLLQLDLDLLESVKQCPASWLQSSL